MKLRITAAVFVGAVFALSVFLFSGFALVVYSAFLNFLDSNSAVTSMSEWHHAAACLFFGGTMSATRSVGGLFMLSVAAGVRPALFEGRIRAIVFWGCATSAFCFVWTFILPLWSADIFFIGPFLAVTVFSWLFVRHVRSKKWKEIPSQASAASIGRGFLGVARLTLQGLKMKTKGDIWNWALVTVALMIIFFGVLGSNFPMPLIIQYGYACLVALGLYSLIIRKSVPILGGVIGAVLFLPVIIISLILQTSLDAIIVCHGIALPDAIAPWLHIPQLFLSLVAVGLLIAALLKRPKEKKGKAQPPPAN